MLKFKYRKIICTLLIVSVIFCCIQDYSCAADVATNAVGPISLKKSALRFLIAMSGVAISSIALFVGLSFYNKIRNKKNIENPPQKLPSEFDSPDTVDSAIKMFISKNKL